MPPLARPPALGGRGVVPNQGSQLAEREPGTVAADGARPRARGRGTLFSRWSQVMQRLRGMVALDGASSRGSGTASPP